MATTPTVIEDGIYFGMPAAIYHAAPHCGSGSIKELYASPPDYWFNSHMNPLREVEEESHALKFGSALHDRILYGEDYFKKHYQSIKGGTKSGEVGADELKKWIEENGGKPSKLKADNERMVVEQWGVTLVAEKVFEKIMVSAQMILKNPNLAAAFTGGFPEVSIFWSSNGVPCKCRLDYMKLGVTVDLKSFRSKDRISSLDRWVLQDLFNYRYDIQMAHYTEGRLAARALFDAGKVFVMDGAARPDDTWLRKALGTKPHWSFVFYKADGMPIAKAFQIPFESPAHETGKAALRLALDNYRDNYDKFGTDPWVVLDEPFNIDNEDIPKWM